MELYIVGQAKENGLWEFQGAFSSKEKAIAACRTEDYFWYSGVQLDVNLPHETVTWDHVEYDYPLAGKD